MDLKDKELAGTKLTLDQKVAEANEWVKKYHELEARLASLGETSELSRQAELYLKDLKLEKAEAALLELTKRGRTDRPGGSPSLQPCADL